MSTTAQQPAAPLATASQPSAEQLQMAWRQMRGRNGCPPTLEAALASPAWGVPLVCLARQLGRRVAAAHGEGAAELAAKRLGTATYVPPTPPSPRAGAPVQHTGRKPAHTQRMGLPLHYPRPAGRDGKRAAANDFED